MQAKIAKLLHLAYPAKIIETSSKLKKTWRWKIFMADCTVNPIPWLLLHQLLLEFAPYLSSITIVDQYRSHLPRGQCVKRPLPRHVVRILSGGLKGFRWDRRRSLASHRSGLNRTSFGSSAFFFKIIGQCCGVFSKKSVHHVVVLCTVL